jgi:hypothetical protein
MFPYPNNSPSISVEKPINLSVPLLVSGYFREPIFFIGFWQPQMSLTPVPKTAIQEYGDSALKIDQVWFADNRIRFDCKAFYSKVSKGFPDIQLKFCVFALDGSHDF